MLQDHQSILEAANAAVSKGDHEGFLSFCTDDVVWNFIGDRVLKGKAAIREYMAETYKTPPKFDVSQWISDGDTLAALGEITLENGEGHAVHYSYCDAWRFRDGKMAELKAFVIETGA